MAIGREHTGYHHGDARNALLAAAGALLEGVGAAGLSLRKVAERAQLSRQAPYNHFASKEALLAALVQEGFTALRDGMWRAATGEGTAVDRLGEAGAAYIGFAMEQPARFRLMFGRELVDVSRHPKAKAASDTAYGALESIIGEIVPVAAVPTYSLLAWSMVHGYATLCNEAGLEGPERLRERAALFARTVAASAASAGLVDGGPAEL